MNPTDREGHIVVGVDGSESSKCALRWAARLALVLDRTIDAVIVWQTPAALDTGFGTTGVVPNDWNPGQDGERLLHETVDDVFGANLPADMRLLTEMGDPGSVLVELGEGAEMLVVGGRGHGGILGMLRGSVSTHCAAHATCPVLVVPSPPDQPTSG